MSMNIEKNSVKIMSSGGGGGGVFEKSGDGGGIFDTFLGD